MKINRLRKLFNRDIFLIFVVAILIAIPLIRDKSILKTNDMSGNVINIVYLKKTLWEYGKFPQWNSSINQGIPIVADPLNTFYNPIILIIFLLFPLLISIKLTYIIIIFSSGLFFYLLLKYLNIAKSIGLLLSFIFMSSGYLAARIYAGHLEKLLSYPLVPLFLLSVLILIKKGGIKWSGIVAIILTMFVFSGAIYEALYAVIILLSIVVFYLFHYLMKRDKTYLQNVFMLIISLIIFLFFSAVKILPLIEIGPYLSHPTDPFTGSQNLISLVYNLFFPFKEIYSIFGIKNFNPNIPYFWWESFAFIGILPLLCLFLTPLVIKRKPSSEFILFIFLFLTIIIFSMLDNWWNPFYWLFKYIPFLKQFRIPSRIFIFLIPVLLLISAITLNYFYKIKSKLIKIIIIMLLVINFSNVYLTFNDKINKNNFIYSPPINDLQNLLNHLKKLDSGYFLIGQSLYFDYQVPIFPAINNEQRIYNHNYGFVLKKSYSSKPDSFLALSPKYFVLPKLFKPPEIFTYKEIYTGSEGSKIYKNSSYTAYADIYSGEAKKLKIVREVNNNIKKIQFTPDKIDVTVNSNNKKDTLLVLESYAPGWKVKNEKGEDLKLLKNDFLNVKLDHGEHTYSFLYNSQPFIIGFFVSFLSFIIWIIYIHKIYVKKYLKGSKLLEFIN